MFSEIIISIYTVNLNKIFSMNKNVVKKLWKTLVQNWLFYFETNISDSLNNFVSMFTERSTSENKKSQTTKFSL